MGFPSVLAYAHKLVEDRLGPGGIAVDATVGNGVDTLFLCKRVGRRGSVYGCDVQERALARARQRLADGLSEPPATLALELRSHHELIELVAPDHRGRVDAVMFNLGYLPGGDDADDGDASADGSRPAPVITEPHTTLPALEAALELLRPGGVLTVVLYPGHAGGDLEAREVEAWAAELPGDRAQAILYRFHNRKTASPYLIAIEKRR